VNHRKDVERIRSKLELLRGLPAAQRLGVIVGTGEPLPAIDGVRAEITDVLSLFTVLRGSCLQFVRPKSITSTQAWEEREELLGCPLDNPFDIGFFHLNMPDDIPGFQGEPVIRVDRTDGGVYYLNGDDYAFYYANDVDEIETHEFEVDTAVFFDEFVLGKRYNELTDVVMGEAAHRRDRKHRYVDSWRTLLEQGGLL
jgi:hypothetical protein